MWKPESREAGKPESQNFRKPEDLPVLSEAEGNLHNLNFKMVRREPLNGER